MEQVQHIDGIIVYCVDGDVSMPAWSAPDDNVPQLGPMCNDASAPVVLVEIVNGLC